MKVSEKIIDPRYRTIIRKTRDIFMKSGIRSISMDDVSRSLGISKKTLYRYFLNKHDLVSKVLEFEFDEINSVLNGMRKSELNAIDELLGLSKVMDDYLKNYNPTVSSDLEKYYPDIFNESRDKKRQYALQYISENIRKGINQGIYRDDLNVDLVARLYIQKIEDLHDPSYFNADQVSLNTVFYVMFENHIRGISNRKGIEFFEKRKKILNY
jgi:AcrR family transcriptional regulator